LNELQRNFAMAINKNYKGHRLEKVLKPILFLCFINYILIFQSPSPIKTNTLKKTG